MCRLTCSQVHLSYLRYGKLWDNMTGALVVTPNIRSIDYANRTSREFGDSLLLPRAHDPQNLDFPASTPNMLSDVKRAYLLQGNSV
jgi:hypothetical protein